MSLRVTTTDAVFLFHDLNMLYFIYSEQHYASMFWKKLAEAVPEVVGQRELPKLQICCNLSKILGGLEDDTFGNAFFPPSLMNYITSLQSTCQALG